MCHHHLFARLLLYQKHVQVALRAKEKHEKFAYILKLCIISSWMHFNRVTNKEHWHSLVVSSFLHIHMRWNSMCPSLEAFLCVLWALTCSIVRSGSSLSRQFSPPFPLSTVYLVWWVPVSLPSVGAHGWVTRICWPWEKSPSRSWLPIVDAPGCFRHPTST